MVENPVVRQISNVITGKRGLCRSFFDSKDEIKILLIGSNTKPNIPGADEEIRDLDTYLPHLFRSRGFNCTHRTIPTDEATYETVHRVLENCQYHIVHYAGHGFHSQNDSDESGISFWEKPKRSGEVKPMPIHVLKNLLQKSDTRFFFLSCCVGAKGTSEAYVKLKGNEFQGILEGLVRIGIPGVLGYRWNIWDDDAINFSKSFYENLLTDLRLDLALYKARCEMKEKKYKSETWASPVIVTQVV